jgi:hypothetical protein
VLPEETNILTLLAAARTLSVSHFSRWFWDSGFNMKYFTKHRILKEKTMNSIEFPEIFPAIGLVFSCWVII